MCRRLILFFVVTVVLAACATYQNKVAKPRANLKTGQVEASIAGLKELAEKPSDDQLVYLLEYGTALQIAGRYKESNEAFAKADKLTEENDYHSISNTTMAALGSEEMLQYKGESYEKMLINVYMALNYLMLNQLDEAMVEVRRIHNKVNKFRQEGREHYEQNPFANYLAGMIWEADGKFDDAFIAYSDAYKLDSSVNPFLVEDLIRTAKKSKRMEDYRRLKKEFPEAQESSDWYDKKFGELILIAQEGWGPEKNFSPVDPRWPKLYPIYSQTVSSRLRVQGQDVAFSSRLVYDLERVVVKTMDDDVGWMIARKMGGVVVKAVVADQIRQKEGELAGFVAALAMRIADRADLRQWSTLPKHFHMVRLWLPAGDYQISLEGQDSTGGVTSDRQENIPIKIRSNSKTFLNHRSLH